MGAPLKGIAALSAASVARVDIAALPFRQGLAAGEVGASALAVDEASLLAASAPGALFGGTAILEQIARGAPLEDVLDSVVRELERRDSSVLASVVLLRGDPARINVVSAPRLPQDYKAALEGLPIGPNVGSCGTAAYWGERVVVSDIATDPLWRDYRKLALAHGLRACWSEPINASDGQVLGTLAMYYRSVHSPGTADLQTAVAAAHIAGIAIERGRTEQSVVRLTKLYRARSELHRLLTKPPGEAQLLQAFCRIAVEFGGMRMAWIGQPHSSSPGLELLARCGQGLEYLDAAAAAVSAEVIEGRGPIGTTVCTGEPVIVNDLAKNPAMAAWHLLAQEYGYSWAGSFAIRRAGEVFAVLGVHSDRAESFDPETIALLCQSAGEVGLALDRLDQARDHEELVRRLRCRELYLQAYFARSLVGMAATGPAGHWIEVNDALCQMVGYTQEELLGKTWMEITHPDDLADNALQWERLRSGASDEFESDKRYLHKNGHVVHARIAGRIMRTAAGKFDCVILVIKDTTERKRTAAALHEKNAFIDSILRNEPECVAVIGPELEVLQINEAGLNMFALQSAEELRRTGMASYVLPRYRRQLLDLHAHAISGGKGVLEFQVRAADGTQRWLEMHATPVHDAANQVAAVLGIARDISDRKRSAEVIWKQANFDLLTGLPNRYMFQDRLGQEIKKARRAQALLGLLFIDLDFFKEVNETLGHETGDALLVAVAQRIAACVRDADTVARLGGDEFTVILPQLRDPATAEQTAQNIVTSLSEGFNVRGESIVLSASVGITYFPTDANSVESLLKNADQALYVAKRQGRNRVGYFTASLQEEARHRLRTINDLRSALASNQFCLYFQAVVDLTTQRICGAEALLRWQHPTRGLVPPIEFIPLAEETGLINAIGDWVFRQAARWAKRWAARPGGVLQVSVNNSPAQFRDPTLLLSWPQFLKEIDLPVATMAMEITEGLLLEADAGTTQVLRQLHDSGIRVSIDDFGTGYSSLSYLHKFPIDILKIDQSFVRNVQTEPSAKALSESIILMGHKLGLNVVAEGVETLEQRDFLISSGCDCAQGYLFSKPIPAEEFDAMLHRGLPLLLTAPDVDL